MKGITFAGNLIVDHLKEIDVLPGRSELAQIHKVGSSTGGCVCNTGMDFAILDPTIPVNAIGVVGDDADGQTVITQLQKYGIKTDDIKIRKGVGTAFTDVYAETSNKARTFFYYGGANDTFDIDDIDIDKLDCKIFHIGYLLLLNTFDEFDQEYGTRLAKLLSKIQAKGIKTSIDIVSENSDRFAKILLPAVKYTDYLIINEMESGRSVGVNPRNEDESLNKDNVKIILQKLFENGVGEWVIIHCPEGAYGLTKTGEYQEIASKKLPKGYIVGTVGAGDAFCAGTLLGAYKGLNIKDAMEYGTAAAQTALKSADATGSMTTIEKALEERNKY